MSGDIYTQLAAVMADCDHVAKRDRNTHQNFMFRGIDAVVNAVGPILRKHQVVVAPNVERCDYDTVQTSTGKPATACRVLVTYSFYATDGSSVDCRVAAEAWDSGDKAAPKAMSVAFRTALLQALALPTDEADPNSPPRLSPRPPRDPRARRPPSLLARGAGAGGRGGRRRRSVGAADGWGGGAMSSTEPWNLNRGVQRSRAAYRADQAIAQGLCVVCEVNKPGGFVRTCVKCRREKRRPS
jgi:hypothetical protein